MADDFDNAHHLLAQALKNVDPAVRPAGPFHGGGPSPKLDGYGYFRAGLWLAERARPAVESRDRATFDRWIDLAHQELSGKGDAKARLAELNQAQAKKASRIPLKMGIWAASEAAYFATRSIYSGTSARFAAAGWAKHLSQAEPVAVGGYLADLDLLCIHFELLSFLRDKKLEVSSEPTATPWRGFDGTRVTHFLSRIDDARWVLVRKVGARWTALEGARDDVIATIEDAHFTTAVAKALGPATA
jgi:hypothetical protein